MKKIFKWISTSLALVAIILTTSAAIQSVYISQVWQEEVTSTSVDLIVTHYGATSIKFVLTNMEDENDVITRTFDIYSDPASTYFSINNLTPNSVYIVQITAFDIEQEKYTVYRQVVTNL